MLLGFGVDVVVVMLAGVVVVVDVICVGAVELVAVLVAVVVV